MCRYIVMAAPATIAEADLHRACVEAGFTPGDLPFRIALKRLPEPGVYIRPTSGPCDCDDAFPGPRHQGVGPPRTERAADWSRLLTSVSKALDVSWLALSPQWQGTHGLEGRGGRVLVETGRATHEQIRGLRDSDILLVRRSAT